MRTLLSCLAALLAASAYAQPAPGLDPPAERARALVKLLDREAQPSFSLLPMPGAPTFGVQWALDLLAQATPDLAWQRHWLTGRIKSSESAGQASLAAATAAFEAAIAAANGPDAERQRLAASIAIASLLWPHDPAAATARLDRINASLPEARAAMAQIRGRIALQAGDSEGALARFGEALATAAAARDPSMAALITEVQADIALAHGLAGRPDIMTAHTATTQRESPVTAVSGSRLPACIPAIGLDTETRVVLRVTRSGTASGLAVPVWSRGPITPLALDQIRMALAESPWQADDSAAATGTRVLLGCAASGNRVGLVNSKLRSTGPEALLDGWLTQRGVPLARRLLPIASDQSPREAVLARIAAAEAANRDDPALVLDYLLLAFASSDSERADAIARAQTQARAGKAPPAVDALLASAQWRGNNDPATLSLAAQGMNAALAAMPAAEQGSVGWLWTAYSLLALRAQQNDSNDRDPASDALLDGIAQRILALPTAKLPANDDLRRLALVAQSRVAENQGRRPAAAALRAQAGLIADLCRLGDARPDVSGYAISEEDFPLLARKADLDGYTAMERLVAPDGRTLSTRIIAARPPLLFDEATRTAADKARQNPPRRAGKPFTCHSNTAPVRWRLRD
jgi:hypothetical protein